MGKEITDLIKEYIERNDWRVNENSNMAYSLQGLNYYLYSTLVARYWLENIYPKDIAKAHQEGDFHIHDLGSLSVYCVGWDLEDLLLRGFGGVEGKIASKPAKHFRTALGQIVNFMFTLQGEAAGAIAFSNFDTFLAPFIAYDGLTYKEVKQALQEFIFNLNIPTRTGFQCLSEDTEILTPEGWKKYYEVNEGDLIYTFNLERKQIEIKQVDYVHRSHYKGIMYNLKNGNQDQLISPGHRVVRQIFNSDKFILQTIEEILELSSPIAIPTSGNNINFDYPISDDELKLVAWVLSEGSIEKNREHYEEIVTLLKNLNLEYSEREQIGWGKSTHIRLLPKPSKVVHRILNSKEKAFPSFLYKLSQRQAKLFIETYTKGDSWYEKGRIRVVTTREDFAQGLSAIGVLASFNVSVRKRKPRSNESRKDQYEITFTNTKTDYIQKIDKVDYEGIIWSVHTENETVIAKRNGQVFITGNTPFTNLSFDLIVPQDLKDKKVIIGGERKEAKYDEFQKEMDMLNEAFAEVMLEGDANGRIFTFPIPTYSITKDFPWEKSTLRKIWEMTAKYGTPYFSNFVNSDLDPSDVRSMCCRLRLSNSEVKQKLLTFTLQTSNKSVDELKHRGGGLFGANPLTGAIGVVSINLPRIGYLSKNEDEFFERLAFLMDLAKESLETKRRVLEDLTHKNLYPYSKYYLSGVYELTGQYWGNHFSTIGIVGMHETCINLLGEGIETSAGREFAIKVLEFMRERLLKYQKETNNLYNLEATPAEGTSYRLARIDKMQFKDIYTSGETEPFYTNSTQLPVNHSTDPFEVLEHQDKLQSLYTGGTVLHIFLGEAIEDINLVKEAVRLISSNYHLPYFTLTPTFSICPEHGYIRGEKKNCPYCGKETEIYSRVVGYYRPVKSWNRGKQEEFRLRKPFVLALKERRNIENLRLPGI